MTANLTELPARQSSALAALNVVAQRAGGAVSDVTWIHRSTNGRGFMGVTELYVEIEIGEITCTLVHFDGVAVGRGCWFGYSYTESIEDRTAVNRLLTERCGEPWTDIAARGW